MLAQKKKILLSSPSETILPANSLSEEVANVHAALAEERRKMMMGTTGSEEKASENNLKIKALKARLDRIYDVRMAAEVELRAAQRQLHDSNEDVVVGAEGDAVYLGERKHSGESYSSKSTSGEEVGLVSSSRGEAQLLEGEESGTSSSGTSSSSRGTRGKYPRTLLEGSSRKDPSSPELQNERLERMVMGRVAQLLETNDGKQGVLEDTRAVFPPFDLRHLQDGADAAAPAQNATASKPCDTRCCDNVQWLTELLCMEYGTFGLTEVCEIFCL